MSIDVDTLMPEIETEPQQELPDANLNTDAPADKEPQARAKDGKFAGKEKETEAKQEPKEKSEHTVPVRTLVDERKAWQLEKKALEERLAKLENPPKVPPPEPDYQTDPKAYTDHKVQAALDQLNGVKQTAEQATQAAQQSAEQSMQVRFLNDLAAAEAAFVQQTPDYHDALGHIRNIRVAQLRMFNPEITQEEIVGTIQREEVQMAIQFARANRNPITSAYELAQAYGYQPKKAQEKLELPQVPGQRKLPPDQTLGSGAAPAPDEEDKPSDPFDEAFQSMFGRRKQA